MRYKLCLIEKTLLYHKADNSVNKSRLKQDVLMGFRYLRHNSWRV